MAVSYSLTTHPALVHEPSESLSPSAAPSVEELLNLAAVVFDFVKPDDFRWRIANMPSFTCVAARRDNSLVGFKLGYATKSTHYYSWLGGVHPDHLRQGIAARMMRAQHDWLRNNGFLSVETGTQEINQPMRALNLASGFTQVGYFDKPRGREIIYLKIL